MSDRPLRIAVVGAGIGGTAATLSLLRAGFDVALFEQAPAFGEVGAGIQISPNASRILHRLVPPAALAQHAVRPKATHQRRWQDGRTLQYAELGAAVEAAFGAPYYHFHRADLLLTLAAAVPPARAHFGRRFAGFEERGETIELRFDNGASFAADLVVGADGIHSAVRTALFGPEKARFTGCIAYRGLVPAERLKHLNLEVTASNWMGPGSHVVHYFVAGGRLVNFVACMERDSWTRESWTDRGKVSDAVSYFADWHPQVSAIIGAVDETFIWALFDRAPLPRWSVGRVTLLGDACHAMLPFMAQGAAMAIEDGAVLAACLRGARPGDVPAALRRYETIRLPRASRLQELSRRNKTRFHMPDGVDQVARDAELAERGDRAIPQIGWLYGHDAEAIEGVS
jgi:salicylate hydroxylase